MKVVISIIMFAMALVLLHDKAAAESKPHRDLKSCKLIKKSVFISKFTDLPDSISKDLVKRAEGIGDGERPFVGSDIIGQQPNERFRKFTGAVHVNDRWIVSYDHGTGLTHTHTLIYYQDSPKLPERFVLTGRGNLGGNPCHAASALLSGVFSLDDF